MNYPTQVDFIIETLYNNGYEAYIVGGCVRDMLLFREPLDFDICTNALPTEVKQCFKEFNVIETGISHGTVTLMLDETAYEITTFRTEGTYSDNRRPDNVNFVQTIEEDLKRRDFTINAMAYNRRVGLVDCFGGERHLKRGIISAVLDPDRRFREDALRIMRGLRFAAVYGFEIEEKCAISMMENRELLKNISAERIHVELSKMLLGKGVERTLLDYRDIIAVIIPELAPCFDFQQHNPHHKFDVYTHMIKAVAASMVSVRVRLTLLLHDIAKPMTFHKDDMGVGHFFGHANMGEKIAQEILQRLKFDKKSISEVALLVKYHDANIEVSSKSVKRWLNRLGRELFLDLIEVKRADNFALQGECDKLRFLHLDEIVKIYEDIIENEECFNLKNLKINGDDIIKLGISEGREVGVLLNIIFEAVLDEKIQNKREILLDYARNSAKSINNYL